jgi:hypothetical protein
MRSTDFCNLDWEYVTSGSDGNCDLFGVNIFEYEWENTGKRVRVQDPIYRQTHSFNIWMVEINNVEHFFAAGEFSNCYWGFYLPKD